MNYGLEDVEVVEGVEGVRMPFAGLDGGARGLGMRGLPADEVAEQERREALGSRRSLRDYLHHRRELHDEQCAELLKRLGVGVALGLVGVCVGWFAQGGVEYLGIPLDLGSAGVSIHAAVKYWPQY